MMPRFSTVLPLIEEVDEKLNGSRTVDVCGLKQNPAAFLDEVNLETNHRIKFLQDTTAIISTEGKLDGQYLRLEPGEKKEMLLQLAVSHRPSTRPI